MRSAWIFSCAFVLGLGLAQGLTLEEAQQRTQQNHPGFKVLEADIAAAKGGVQSARAWSNPDLAIAPGIKRSTGEGSSQTRFRGDFSLEQTFEFPGKRSLRVSLAEGNVRVREIALEGFRQQLLIEVRRAYFRLLVAGEIASLRAEQIESARLFFQSAQKRVQGGYASDFELLKAEADLIGAQKALREAGGEARQAKLQLAALMGAPSDTAFQVEGRLEDAAFPPLKGDPTLLAMERNPAVRAQSLQVEIASQNLRATKMATKPDLTVGPSVEYASDEQVYGVNFSLPLPVWNRGKGSIASASAEQRRSLAELEKVKQEITASVEAAQGHLQSSEDQLALYTPEFLGRLKNLMARAEKVYGQNMTSLLIYLEAKRSYFESLADYYAALNQRAESQLELESAIGISPADPQTIEVK